MPLERTSGIRYGDRIVTRGTQPSLRVGPEMLGRVIDGSGKPIDGAPPYRATEYWPLNCEAPLPLQRVPIRARLGCGIRAIDGLLTCGRGQRVGIFWRERRRKKHPDRHDDAGNGGRSDCARARWASAGAKFANFLTKPSGLMACSARFVVVSTSDQSPLLRIRAALAATSVAEYFSGLGKTSCWWLIR